MNPVYQTIYNALQYSIQLRLESFSDIRSYVYYDISTDSNFRFVSNQVENIKILEDERIDWQMQDVLESLRNRK